MSQELTKVQRALGFEAEARQSLSNANQALRASGLVERIASDAAFEPDASQPPDSGVQQHGAEGAAGNLLARLEQAVKP